MRHEFNITLSIRNVAFVMYINKCAQPKKNESLLQSSVTRWRNVIFRRKYHGVFFDYLSQCSALPVGYVLLCTFHNKEVIPSCQEKFKQLQSNDDKPCLRGLNVWKCKVLWNCTIRRNEDGKSYLRIYNSFYNARHNSEKIRY